MKKRLGTAFLAAAVAFTSVQAVPYMGVQPAAAATTKKPTTSSSSELTEKSADGRVTETGFTFQISGNEATITGYTGTVKDLKVPIKISIPQTVTVPGTTQGSGTTNTGTGTGTGTTTQGTGTSKIKATSSKTKEPEVPTNDYVVTAIADNAFNSKLGIKSIVMSNSTTNGRTNGIKKIGKKAFFGCHDLTSVTIAATTTEIGTGTFADCIALTSIKVADGNQNFKTIDGALYSYSTESGSGIYRLEQYPLGNKSAEYKVSESLGFTLGSIGQEAFLGSQNLETVELPITVKTIGDRAFAQCKKLKTVTLPQDLATLGTEAFQGDIALEEITLPETVTTINAGTFQDCQALKSAKLPEKLTAIGANAFQNCKALGDVELPSGVASIGERAYAQCSSLKMISIPMKTNVIGKDAFDGAPVKIHCHSGSQASTYAKQYNLETERIFTVEFYTDNSYRTLISSQEVVEETDATLPEFKAEDGYEVTGWSADHKKIKQDLRIYPIQKKVYEVKFTDPYNGRETTVKVTDGGAPEAPDWTMEGFSLRWNPSIPDDVHSNQAVSAVWTSNTTGKEIQPGTVKPEDVGDTITSGKNNYQVISADPYNPTVAFIGLEGTEAETSAKNSALTLKATKSKKTTASKATSTSDKKTAAAKTATDKKDTEKYDSIAVKIPASISIDGVTYKVTEVAAKALNNNMNITSVEVGGNVKEIKGKAFYKCSRLSKVRLKTKKIIAMGSGAFKGVKAKATFYTFNSKISKYKSLLKKAGVKKPTMKQL